MYTHIQSSFANFSRNITGKKNGIVTATKLGTINNFFCCYGTKNFAAATKCFVDRTKHLVVVTKYSCYPYFNKLFCWYNKTFSTVLLRLSTVAYCHFHSHFSSESSRIVSFIPSLLLTLPIIMFLFHSITTVLLNLYAPLVLIVDVISTKSIIHMLSSCV